jgi:hypothetical protein
MKMICNISQIAIKAIFLIRIQISATNRLRAKTLFFFYKYR